MYKNVLAKMGILVSKDTDFNTFLKDCTLRCEFFESNFLKAYFLKISKL